MKMGFSFYTVSKFHSFMLYSFTLRCSNNKNGKNINDMIKYLHEFLVRGYDFISASNQQGTNAEKSTLVSSRTHAVIELISIWELKFSSALDIYLFYGIGCPLTRMNFWLDRRLWST